MDGKYNVLQSYLTLYNLPKTSPCMSFPCSSAGKEFICNAGDLGSIPGLGRSPREGKGYPHQYSWAFLVAQLVKNPPAMQETWVQSLGWEDTLEKGKATHSVFWPREFHGPYSPWGCKESDTTEWLSLHFMVVLFLDFWKTPCVFHKGGTSVHFCWQCTGVPLSQNHCHIFYLCSFWW